MKCSADGCQATVKDHRWGRIKSGWFFSKDGTAWCPEHTPAWVAVWRSRKDKG